MIKRLTIFMILLFSFSHITSADTIETDQLIISEYVHLPGNNGGNKAIELYNGTDDAIELSNYSIVLYVNGADIGESDNVKREFLSGTLAPRQTFILVNQNADAELLIEPYKMSTLPTFNGDDAVVLLEDDEIIDRFGQVGVGEVFSGGSTGPEVWQRKLEITTGDTDAQAPFDIYEEWTNQGDAHSLGSHGASVNKLSSDVDTGDISTARQSDSGDFTVTGVVTARHNNTLHIQDDSHAIAIFRQRDIPNVSIGDEITVRGTRGDYGGLKQLQNPVLISINGVKTATPTVLDDVQQLGELDSMLVTVENVELGPGSLAGADATNYPVVDKDIVVRDENSAFDFEVDKLYTSITGTLSVYNDQWQLMPRSEEDVVADITQVETVKVDIMPGRMPLGTELKLTTATPDAEIYYTYDGSVPNTDDFKYEGGIVLDEPGSLTITAIAVSESLESSQVSQWTYEVNDGEYTLIHEIQGPRHVSPYDGAHVRDVYGIVTFYYTDRGNHYFHIQTPDDLYDSDPNTSEGLLVFTANEHPLVEVGDEVMISGTVQEYYIDGFDDKEETDLPVTQLNAREFASGEIRVLSRGNDLPAPILISHEDIPDEIASFDHFNDGLEDLYFNPEDYAIDFWESIEGMRVQVNDPYAVAPQAHGDIITTLNRDIIDTEQGGILLTENGSTPQLVHFRMHDNQNARSFPIKTGDYFEGPLIGHVSYAYQFYKLNISLEDMQDALVEGDTTPSSTKIVQDDEKLTIASYNLENFSALDLQTPDEKAQKLARAIVDDLGAPDIVGVTEVQDEDGPMDSGNPSAEKSYERLVNVIHEYGGPAYQFAHIDPIDKQDGGQPGSNIQVGFLYNPERVNLKEGIPHGGAEDSVGYENASLTLNPGRINPTSEVLRGTRKPLVAQFEFNNEDVLVIVNHWNSKLGDDPEFGRYQPADTASEDKRIQISMLVQDFIREVVSDNSEANIVSVGDFNAFQWEESMLIQEDEFMTNKIHEVPEAERYSYIYNGNSQVLDHLLVSNHLVEQTIIDTVKINADFTNMHGRASDHDPVMIQIDFSDD